MRKKTLTREEFNKVKVLSKKVKVAKDLASLCGLSNSTITKIRKSDTFEDYKEFSKKEHPQSIKKTWKFWPWKKNTQ